MKLGSFVRAALAFLCIPGMAATGVNASASVPSVKAISSKLKTPALKEELKIMPGSCGSSYAGGAWPFRHKNRAQRDRLRAAFRAMNKI